MNKYTYCAFFAAWTLLLRPAVSLAEEGLRINGAAFVDSLQYMLKGMAGIFIVTGLIILLLIALEKATKPKGK